jgi:thiosulfate/3-mercaptopyruvate sulfurtransferase
VTACQLILAGELAGRRLALYPGSYSQWCALGRPVATGS